MPAVISGPPGPGVPAHPVVVAEEDERRSIRKEVLASPQRVWVIDPIDGTVNFVYGIPAYAVSNPIYLDTDGDGKYTAPLPAPASRYARLLGSGSHPQALARKQARQNAAELAALPDATPHEHLAAFMASARANARRLPSVWDLPHHQYRDTVVTVAGMAGAATAEWHLHAWDLARSLGADHRPADPEAVLAGWRAGMAHLPATIPGTVPGRPAPRRPPAAGPAAAPVPSYAVARRAYRTDDPWPVLLRASGRRPG